MLPKTFDFLLQSAKNGNFHLKRTIAIQREYELHKQRNVNMHDYIMKTYLQDQNYNLVLNRFPYDVEENISHYVLWMKNGIFLDIDEYLKSRFFPKRFVFWTNPPELKSIPSIIHHHVFVEEYTISKL